METMASLANLEIFTHVAEARSFTRAARALGVAKGTASKAVGALEAELGVILLRRSSRSVTLTEAGKLLAGSGRAVLDEAEGAGRRVRELRDTPTGVVRLNTTTGVAAHWLAPALRGFLDAHPRVDVVLDASDERVDAVHGGYDVVVRLGRLRDSAIRARRLGTAPLVCVAAPSYLAARGTPHGPEDLADHDCVVLGTMDRPERWPFRRRAERRVVTVPRRVETSSDVVARQVILGGAGVGILPAFMAEADLAAGRLLSVVAGWEQPPVPVHALLPTGGEPTAKVRALVDWLVRLLRTPP